MSSSARPTRPVTPTRSYCALLGVDSLAGLVESGLDEWELIATGDETPSNHTSSIGLWLVYWSVAALGDTVELTPNDPRGSIITVRVPLGPESV